VFFRAEGGIYLLGFRPVVSDSSSEWAFGGPIIEAPVFSDDGGIKVLV
jgi:hypothetical protein